MTTDRRLSILAFCILICSVGAYPSEQGAGQSVAKDVSSLYSENARIQAEAASRLIATGPSAISQLVPVVCDRARPHFDVAWPVAARILGELRAEAAAPCLVDMLMYKYPSIGTVVTKSDETLAGVDSAFAALLRIGEPAVPAIRKRIPFLGPEPAIMALRVLRAINTPSAREASEAYLKVLQDQIRFTKQVLRDFGHETGGNPGR